MRAPRRPWRTAWQPWAPSQVPLASAYNAGDAGSAPGSGRSPGAGNGNPRQVLAWRTHGRRSPAGTAQRVTQGRALLGDHSVIRLPLFTCAHRRAEFSVKQERVAVLLRLAGGRRGLMPRDCVSAPTRGTGRSPSAQEAGVVGSSSDWLVVRSSGASVVSLPVPAALGSTCFRATCS